MIDPKRAIEALRSWFKDRGGTTTPVEIVDAVELGALAIELATAKHESHRTTAHSDRCPSCMAIRAWLAATKDLHHD
jgi:hypothetical protein